jgi:hypothetical protein
MRFPVTARASPALWHIVSTRMVDDPTQHYIERPKDGRTKNEAIRCLEPYMAQEVFAALGRSKG